MAIYTSLTGLNGASNDLSVISNNIANVGSNGFKKSRATFGDIFGSSALSDPKKTVGLGASLARIDQQFTQGSVQSTGNTLDLAITGSGFFLTRSARGEETFTRNGAFTLDPSRYVVDAGGARLQAFPVNADGVPTATGIEATRPIQIPETSGVPVATTALDLTVNLDAAAPVIVAPFDPRDAASYNGATSTTIFDAGGNPLNATVYYRRTGGAPANTWDAHVFVGDDQLSTTPGPITPIALDFDPLGVLVTPSAPVTFEPYTPPSGASPLVLAADHGAQTSQRADPFNTIAFDQDGAAPGRLDSLTIDKQGLMRAGFTNGDTRAVGRIALADFSNPSGLKQLGDARWRPTGQSGALLFGEAGGQGLGEIVSGSIERSNVVLTDELVNLIVAQRNFQANSKAVDTDGTMLQSIININ